MGDIEKGTVGSSFAEFQRIEELEAKLAEVTAERDLRSNHLVSAEAQVDRLLALTTALYDRAETAEAALKTVRRAALEEALKVARAMNNGETAKAITKAIRALIEEETPRCAST